MQSRVSVNLGTKKGRLEFGKKECQEIVNMIKKKEPNKEVIMTKDNSIEDKSGVDFFVHDIMANTLEYADAKGHKNLVLLNFKKGDRTVQPANPFRANCKTTHYYFKDYATDYKKLTREEYLKQFFRKIEDAHELRSELIHHFTGCKFSESEFIELCSEFIEDFKSRIWYGYTMTVEHKDDIISLKINKNR